MTLNVTRCALAIGKAAAVVLAAAAPQYTRFKNNYLTEMCSGSEEGSYSRRIHFCIAQL